MLTQIMELRQQRAKLFADAQALLGKAEAEKRELSAEDRQTWDRLMTEMDGLKARVEQMERLEAIGAELNSSQRQAGLPGGTTPPAGGNVRAGDPYRKALDLRMAFGPGRLSTGLDQALTQGLAEQAAYRQAFWRWTAGGNDELDQEQRGLLRTGFQMLPQEARAMGVGSVTAGGYLVPDEDMLAIVDAMKFWGGIREAARIIGTATGADLPIPTSDDTANKGRRLAENTQAATATTPTIGQKILRGYTYTSDVVLASLQLMQDAPGYFEGWLTGKFGERIGRIVNEECTTGAGSVMPEGIVTAATLCKTTASASAITWDELVDLEHSVNRAYRRGARWMMADSLLKYLKQQKDGNDGPLWLPGIEVREPDTILGYPFTVNDDMAALAASAKVILFGDFRNYILRDVRGITVLRLVERYADYLQVGFLAFSRHDGALVDAGQHPVKYMQMHA